MKLNSIQFLRAVAVILVTYNHSIDIQMQFGTSWQQNTHLQKFGAIGVDLFFVISGFIISFVANKYTGIAQGLSFLKKRFIRINPIYYIASLVFLCTTIIRSWIIGSSGLDFRKSLSSFIDTILIVPVTDTTANYLPLLRIGWTLSFEWLFYFLFFLLILFEIKHKFLLLFIVVVLLIALNYLIPSNAIRYDLRFAFITNPILLEFLLGTIIYQVYTKVKMIPASVPVLLLAAGVTGYILLMCYGYGDIWNSFYQRDESLKRFLLWGLPSSFIVAGSIFLEDSKMFKPIWKNNWMQLIGNASYSIYLFHLSIYVLFTALYVRSGFFIPADASIFVQLLIAVLAGVGFYKIVERPFLQALHQWNSEVVHKHKSLLIEGNS